MSMNFSNAPCFHNRCHGVQFCLKSFFRARMSYKVFPMRAPCIVNFFTAMVLCDFVCFTFLWEVAKCAHVCVPEVVGTERRAVAERALLRVTHTVLA